MDIVWIAETDAGAQDRIVLDRAVESGRILMTFDKDFAELVFHQPSPSVVGVMLPRFGPRSPQRITDLLHGLLQSGRDWQGFFSVIDETRIRMVPMPRR